MSILPNYIIERTTRANRWGFVVLLGIAVILISVPLWGDSSVMHLLVEFFYYLALAQMWNLLAGYSGMVSVGQQAFVGLGSYAFLIAAAFLGVPPLLALPIAGIAAAILAIPSALILFRLLGAYFAIGTWALAEVFRLFFAEDTAFGAGTGLSLPISVIRDIAAGRTMREIIVYYIGLGIGLGALVFVFLWLRSRGGLALTAIRDSITAAASVGINQRRMKLLVYVIAGGISGLVGALIVLQKLRITPDAAFSVQDWSANVIFMVVIGGIGSIEGPIIGTIVFFVLRSLLADYGTWYLIMLGVVAVIVMIKAPTGIWGYFVERFDFLVFPVRRHVRLLQSDIKSRGPLERIG